MSQTFKHADIQLDDTVTRKPQKANAETTRVLCIDHKMRNGQLRRCAFVEWPSSRYGAWVMCDSLVKVSES